VFGPISGAHFNPLVSLVAALRRELGPALAVGYGLAQAAGAIAGVWAAHAMFAAPILQVSARLRDGPSQVFSEAVAAFGLILTILATVRFRPAATPAAVGLYITAAYWFTASTSFANPAVTVARSLTDSFSGIAPGSVPGFLVGQLAGALAAAGLSAWLLPQPEKAI
jgi:glycerol uptake facilitator-like aquaporin